MKYGAGGFEPLTQPLPLEADSALTTSSKGEPDPGQSPIWPAQVSQRRCRLGRLLRVLGSISAMAEQTRNQPKGPVLSATTAVQMNE